VPRRRNIDARRKTATSQVAHSESFAMSAPQPAVADRLTKTKQGLLDLTLRNRLLNTPRKAKGRNVEIVGESTEDVYRMLVDDGKSLAFAARPGTEDETSSKKKGMKSFRDAPQVDFETTDPNASAPPAAHAAADGRDADEPSEEDEILLYQPDESPAEATKRRTDDRLQTALTSEALQKRLLGLFYDARTYEEEQGVNILYLALGFLKWYEPEKPDQARYAPLLLVPVELSRSNVGSNFRLRWRDEETATNLSLQAKLQADFGLKFPDIVDGEEFKPSTYFDEVRRAIEGRSGWEVLPNDMILWFFSFTKFLMYRDLDPATWPEAAQIDKHPLIGSLLGTGFAPQPPFCSETDRLDALLSPLDQTHVVDADSSQAMATEETRRGQNLVIQGPPGTGKSQTIANIIATAVKNGKKVLFVAEKMAALSVVKRRLDNIGLGDICLELHSAKANKKFVLQELERTLALGPPQQDNVEQQAASLAKLRERLNRHVADLHEPLQPAGLTPFAIVGEICRLQTDNVPSLDLELVEPLKWTAADVEEKRNLLRAAATQVGEIGVPDQNSWRGVMLDAWLPMNAPRFSQKLPPLIDRLGKFLTLTDALAAELRLPAAPRSIADSAGLVLMVDAVEKAPPMDRAAIGSSVWETNRAGIEALVEAGFTLGDTRAKLEPILRPEAWTRDMTETRDTLVKYGRLWYRWFFGAYRAAKSQLQAILIGPLPKRFDDRIAILDALARRQAAQKKLGSEQQSDALGRQAFGTIWNGEKSDWAALRAIEQWETGCRSVGISAPLRAVMTIVQASPKAREAAGAVTAAGAASLTAELETLLQELQLDVAGAFGKPTLKEVPLAELRDRLATWPGAIESLTKWIAYRHARTALESEGFGTLPSLLASGQVAPESAVDVFMVAYLESLIRAAFAARPTLAQFDGKSYTQARELFQAADRKRIDLARLEVAAAHYKGIPTGTAAVGEIGIVQHELKKRKNHKPIRRLIKEAGRAIQAIKPVFMMSPMSVAQFLDPTSTNFDLLVFDEASQVRPEDALGAIARAGQVVVVGDDKQLPPTRFFDVMEGSDVEPEEGADDFNIGDLDSVLALCKSQRMAERMLRWHYRSRHQSLIAVSNHEFYDDKLFIFPSPLRASGEGLKFNFVKDGRFDRGASATNRIEARVVAEAVMMHARTKPQVSLGVGAFSVSQRDAILDELEVLRRESKETEEFFSTGGPEPFFVKNLENIQGDEREAIFISVGYARDKSGNLAMNFGPLSNKGGERRLNVLISRARASCEVFSSITADDIDLGRATAVGAKAFKTFLHYAQTGSLDVGTVAAARFETEFERQVAAALRGAGYQVESQVGIAGFFIDLAIVDPEVPGGYVLGIECDGRQYDAARSSRDRDRLRQQVLEDRGWKIHRLWSIDWFHRPTEQLAKLTTAIDAAKAAALVAAKTKADEAQKAAAVVVAPKVSSPVIARVERQEPEELSIPYEEATFKISGKTAIPEMPAATLLEYVVRVVRVEGPIHEEEVERRIVSLSGASRTGARIAEAVANALSAGARAGAIVADGGFYRPIEQKQTPIRNREEVESAGLKKPEMLPSAEIDAAIKALIAGHVGVSEDECLVAVARMLGFKTTTPALKETIYRCLEKLVAAGSVVRKNESLHLAG
jgi:very-short-patch-repair endonuclease/DNA polymerase III delta prime subunit